MLGSPISLPSHPIPSFKAQVVILNANKCMTTPSITTHAGPLPNSLFTSRLPTQMHFPEDKTPWCQLNLYNLFWTPAFKSWKCELWIPSLSLTITANFPSDKIMVSWSLDFFIRMFGELIPDMQPTCYPLRIQWWAYEALLFSIPCHLYYRKAERPSYTGLTKAMSCPCAEGQDDSCQIGFLPLRQIDPCVG